MGRSNKSTIEELQNLHLFLWLLKDTFWILNFKYLALFLILPTISLAVYFTWLQRRSNVDLLHNLALTFWITGNSSWIVGDFFFNDQSRAVSSLFFIIGIIILLYYYFKKIFSINVFRSY